MLATRSANTLPSQSLPQAVDAFVGSALELMIHSVEAMRDRVLRLAMRGVTRQT
jgi:hypothetical protein